MSQREAKYIAQLLRANHDKVLRYYRESRGASQDQRTLDCDNEVARRALNSARDRVLLDLAKARNVVHVEWEHEEDAYDFGDIGDLPEREQKRLETKLERGVASVECMVVHVRDKAGSWEIEDSLGMVWIESQADRDCAERDYIDIDPIRTALYRHRNRSDFSELTRRYVPGRWVTE